MVGQLIMGYILRGPLSEKYIRNSVRDGPWGTCKYKTDMPLAIDDDQVCTVNVVLG